jgi:hypothetical protein
MDKPHRDSRKLIDLVSILVKASPRGRGAALALRRIGGTAQVSRHQPNKLANLVFTQKNLIALHFYA